ncbi:hypothetical protein LCGC14_0484570 [marine sediment metagenome]|uniref:Heat-inducible transcription repressor HrcA C-terminal domain-containing protein n=1 Tax=marine sediment metagenome TaxID=412755 RepID=A0A0F9VH64_9ZZZZ
MDILTDRKRDVLQATIKEYIKNAKPVSSKHLKGCGFQISSATLRCTLAALEVDGYLNHPHTSAGRIPTEKGYMYYVNLISKNLILGLEQRRYIMDFFSAQTDAEVLKKETSKFLAEITSYLGIVTGSSNRKIGVKHVDLVVLNSSQLLVVVISKSGEIFKETVHIRKHDFDVQELENILNRELSGLDTEAVKEKCRYLSAVGLYGSLFDEVSSKLIQLLENEQSDFYYDGITNLLDFPEFSAINVFSGVLDFFEEGHATLADIGAKIGNGDFYIAIGRESSALSLDQASLILAPYCNRDTVVGAVGLLGPMRMDYGKALAATECVAGNLTQTLQKMA